MRNVAARNSRSAPSAWLDEVRILVGQYGHTTSLSSCSGGCGRMSS
jgi:hypothetical protein